MEKNKRNRSEEYEILCYRMVSKKQSWNEIKKPKYINISISIDVHMITLKLLLLTFYSHEINHYRNVYLEQELDI